MGSDVLASGMFPSRSSRQHGPPSLRRVPVPSGSPTSSLLCSPPTPHAPSAATPVVPCDALPPNLGGEHEASQVAGPSSCLRAAILKPRPSPPPLTPNHEEDAAAFELRGVLGSGNTRFSWPTHAAHRLACLRINRPVTGPAARLATDLPGSALIGRALHPLDDKQDFRSSATSFPLDQPCLVAPRTSSLAGPT